MKLKLSKLRAAQGFLSVFVALGLAGAGHAAVSFTGSIVEVNFDSMAGDSGVVGFVNDATVPGLMLYLSGGAGTGALAGVPDAVWRGTSTASGTGSTTYPSASTFAFYFYRPTGSTDISLGLYNADTNSRTVGVGYIAAGIALVNNTGQSIPGVVFNYEASGSSATNLTNPDPISVSYAYNAAGVSDTNAFWTDVDGLGYSIAGNGVVTPPASNQITGLDWAPGQTLVIRFRDGNVGLTDRLSFIDNITIAAIPEPSPMLLGGLGVGLLALRRRVGR